MANKKLFIGAVFGFIFAGLMLGNYAAAQAIVDEVQAVPVTEVENWLDSAFKLLMAGLGIFIAFIIKTAVDKMSGTLPAAMADFVSGWLDEKRQKDLQQAILSSLSTIIKDGRWTGNAADFIQEIKQNIVGSTPQAARHNGISLNQTANDDALINLANRKALEVQSQIAETLASAAIAADGVNAMKETVNTTSVEKLIESVTAGISTK